jgi:uroporphyrinogen decarboxylase
MIDTWTRLGGREGRIPASFWLHFPPDEKFGYKAVEAHRSFYAETHVDFLKVMNECLVTVPAYLNSPSDWNYVKPFRSDTGFVLQQLDIIKALADTLGDTVPLLATIHGVFASAFHACRTGEDRFSRNNPVAEHLLSRPEPVLKGLKAIAEGLAEFSLACLDAGAQGIYYAALGGEAYRFTAEQFETWIKPFDLLVLKALHQRTNLSVLHICKDQVRLPLYADYPSPVVNWAVHESNLSPEEGAKVFPGKIILGGLDDRAGVLVDGNREEIISTAEDLKRRMKGIPFIAGADCTLPTEISTERIRWAMEAFHGE